MTDPTPPDAEVDTISLDELPCRHTALLREMAARLERMGGPMAVLALNVLADSTLAHIETVERTIALIEAFEAIPLHIEPVMPWQITRLLSKTTSSVTRPRAN